MVSRVNCSLLAKRTDFKTYARELVNATGGDLQLLSHCKNEVCLALWGGGNSDVSGIGMIVGYLLEQVLGLILGALVLIMASSKRSWAKRVSRDGLSAFHDCAIFFAFSFEIAAIVVLVREDFGISTKGMGDDTVRITQAVSMLVLLPLLYALLILPWNRLSRTTNYEASELSSSSKENDSEKDEGPRRFSLFVLCWALAFYPFFSKMNAAFGPNQFTRDTITLQQFQVIQSICFGPIRAITTTEDNFMTAFVVLAYTPLSICVVGCLLWQGIEQNHRHSKVYRLLDSFRNKFSNRTFQNVTVVGLITVPLLSSGLLWSVLRVQHLQRELSTTIGGADADGTWTFGQIVAVTVFAPVLVECWNSYQAELSSLHEESPSPAQESESFEAEKAHCRRASTI